MNKPSQIPLDPHKALVTARILWLGILAGPIVFSLVIAFVLLPGQSMPGTDVELYKTLFYINAGLLFGGLFVGYTLRNQMYKKHWVNEVVTPQGYVSGNLLLWAIAEGNVFFSLVIVLLAGEFLPYIWTGIGGVLSLALNFPTGHMMFPPRETIG